jgi:hypothetical protein
MMSLRPRFLRLLEKRRECLETHRHPTDEIPVQEHRSHAMSVTSAGDRRYWRNRPRRLDHRIGT